MVSSKNVVNAERNPRASTSLYRLALVAVPFTYGADWKDKVLPPVRVMLNGKATAALKGEPEA